MSAPRCERCGAPTSSYGCGGPVDECQLERDLVKYLIWSYEHAAWWREGGWGYTTDVKAAGVFTLDRASEIVQRANAYVESPNEAMVPASLLPVLTDIQDILLSGKLLQGHGRN